MGNLKVGQGLIRCHIIAIMRHSRSNETRFAFKTSLESEFCLAIRLGKKNNNKISTTTYRLNV